jgi:hypothetical protein
MRLGLIVALTLAALLVPARPAVASCADAGIPIYPDAVPNGGLQTVGSRGAWEASPGRTIWSTSDELRNIQMFYFVRLTNSGWMEVAQLPGQYPEQFQGNDRGPVTTTLPMLEFSRGTSDRVRIIGEAGGYSIWLDCVG